MYVGEWHLFPWDGCGYQVQGFDMCVELV
jgi:hypothetical protein